MNGYELIASLALYALCGFVIWLAWKAGGE
jgi:hypothetical protein